MKRFLVAVMMTAGIASAAIPPVMTGMGTIDQRRADAAADGRAGIAAALPNQRVAAPARHYAQQIRDSFERAGISTEVAEPLRPSARATAAPATDYSELLRDSFLRAGFGPAADTREAVR